MNVPLGLSQGINGEKTGSGKRLFNQQGPLKRPEPFVQRPTVHSECTHMWPFQRTQERRGARQERGGALPSLVHFHEKLHAFQLDRGTDRAQKNLLIRKLDQKLLSVCCAINADHLSIFTSNCHSIPAIPRHPAVGNFPDFSIPVAYSIGNEGITFPIVSLSFFLQLSILFIYFG